MRHILRTTGSFFTLLLPFLLLGQCTSGYSTSPTSGNYSSAAGSASFQVNIPAGCGYFAVPGNCFTWIGDMTSGPTGTVSFFRSANTSCNSRSCTIVITNGSQQVATFNVTQQGLSLPQPGTITGVTSLCEPSEQVYSIPSMSGATSYTWSYTGEGTPAGSSNTITFTPLSSGVLSVVANNSCGSSVPRTVAIDLIGPPDQPGSITGSTLICESGSGVFEIDDMSGVSGYTWLFSGEGEIVPDGVSVTLTPVSDGVLTVFATNICGEGTPANINISLTNIPDQPEVIQGDELICLNMEYAYSVPVMTGVDEYVWTLPSSWSGSSTTASILVVTGDAGGEITVAAVNECGVGEEAILMVDLEVSSLVVGEITGPAQLCGDAEATYSVEAVVGAVEYIWQLPDGWSGTSTTETIDVTAGMGAGMVQVFAFDGCTYSEPESIAVSNISVPAMPSPIIGGSLTVCAGATQVYSVNAVTGAESYIWTLPNGTWSGSSATSSITTVVGTSGGPLQVAAVNECGTGPVRTANINVTNVPAALNNISGETTPCVNENYLYSTNPVSGIQYQWAITGATQASATTPTAQLSVTWTQEGPQTITVSPSNSCGIGTSTQFAVVVEACTSVEEHYLSGPWKLYPNPTDGTINMEYDGTIGGQIADIQVLDAAGRLLMIASGVRAVSLQERLVIDLGSLPRGTHYIKITTRDKVQVLPVVKM